MKASAVKYTVLTWVSSLTILIILLMPFHAFLTVWLSSLFGHYTLLRLWKEVLLLICAIGAVFLLVTDRKIRTHTISRRLFWLILAFTIVTVAGGIIALSQDRVTDKAFGYGLITDLRFFAFFLVTWAVSLRLVRMRTHWQWVTLWPAAVVVAFGLLQVFLLSKNFLTHFGYGPSTIAPYGTINSNDSLLRFGSTLRGPNPYGAYLIIPISFLSVLLLKRIIQKRQLLLLAASGVGLFFTFSRSAWIGAVVSLVIAVFLGVKTEKVRRIATYSLLGAVVVAAITFVALQNNSRFQNFIFHTEDSSQVAVSSNDNREKVISGGVRDIVHEPLGRGVGTAGPASAYNEPRPARIAENFFLQIGQESGLLGMLLFVIINIGVGYLLWLRRSDPLALALFASFIGLTIVNLLSHAWADDTLAYIWWGLAGIAMAPNLKEERAKQDGQQPSKT